MKVMHGDLLDLAEAGEFDVIIHGCNCHCDMGGGIAAQMRQRFPEAYEADLQSGESDQKLGDFSLAEISRGTTRFVVINAYTQVKAHGDGRLVDYQAVRDCFRKVARQFAGKRIAYPRIGAGLARGDWQLISKIIDEELQGCDHTLVIR